MLKLVDSSVEQLLAARLPLMRLRPRHAENAMLTQFFLFLFPRPLARSSASSQNRRLPARRLPPRLPLHAIVFAPHPVRSALSKVRTRRRACLRIRRCQQTLRLR